MPDDSAKVKASRPTKDNLDDNGQLERFKKAARELGADDDLEAFKRRLKKLMEAPPPDESVPGSKKKPKADKPAK